jgi:hypothetical protein
MNAVATSAPTRPLEQLEQHWRVAASALLALGGALNTLTGVALWANDTYVPADLPIVNVFQFTDALRIEQQLATGDAGGWSWFLILVGVAQLASAVGVLRKRFVGVAGGILFVTLALFGSLALLPSYLVLTVVMVVVEVVLLGALLVYGSRFD